jgi:hypothetical protein
MTIAIALKIGDGLILSADSAVTIANPGAYPDNVYLNAEKIINLVKGLPLGAATWGLGGFARRSNTRLAKDLRRRLSDPTHPWWVNPERYTVEEVARRVEEFFVHELYRTEYPNGGPGTGFGFMIAGYGPDAARGEVWAFDVLDDGTCHGPSPVLSDEMSGLFYRGQGEALHRLLRGWSSATVERLTAEDFPQDEVIRTLESVAPLWNEAMPIQDGIDLVRYLIEVTAGFVRYMAEPTTVAPPIDLAAITLHEGFRWVSRKHYFTPELNRLPGVHERGALPPVLRGTDV